ncbi:hypothetical protein A4D02_29200 [Niastella koreensis]|uniref:Regulator of chromosome condensation RCC1 n=2 Tax=Niastella koreensis TaxID=354356 RepID=G8TRA1_NIAKG|nr:hypothetical protein [Niastella koreensis]AEW00023.1 hypothetical protein Niako_3726 [Niastella koreensis GR20-10]OQP49666.1 hypothetical protein A4D02_29200 [Niastella koreensis]
MLRIANSLQLLSLAAGLFFTGAMAGCNKDPEYTPVVTTSEVVYDFWLEKTASNPNLNRPYRGMILGDTAIRLMVDYGTDITALEPTIIAYTDSIEPTGKQNFTNPVKYTIKANGKTATYTVRISVNPVQSPVVTAIAGGFSHILALKNDGTLWACGSNDNGELGLGDYSSRNKLTQVPIYDVAKIYTGDAATVIKLKDGTAWGSGNGYGQLGVGNKNATVTFIRSPFMDDAVQVAITSYEVFVLKPDGTVWGSGRNYNYQLAQGDNDLRATFVKVPISNVKQLSGNGTSIVVQKTNGEVWGWGDNYNGELGLGDRTKRKTPVLLPTPGVGIAKIFAGGASTFLIDNNGKIWGSGANVRGQLGIADLNNRDTFSRVTFFDSKTIDAVIPHSGAASFKESNGTVWNVGDNFYGLIGKGTTATIADSIPVKLNGFTAATVTGSGGTAYALKGDGTLWAWGRNTSGTLGTALDTTYMASPIQIK